MKKIFFSLVILFFTTQLAIATRPATPIKLNKSNIQSLGFKYEYQKIENKYVATFSAPPIVEKYWTPSTTQVVYLTKNDKNGLLSKVQLGNPRETVTINLFYDYKLQDVQVGVYYTCKESLELCGEFGERFYGIDSVEKYRKSIF